MSDESEKPQIPYDLIWLGNYDRTDPKVSYQRGQLAYSQSDYERAIEELRHAIELKSDYLDAHLLLANSFKASQKFDSAIYAFEEASKFISNKDLIKTCIGTVYDIQGKHEEAIKCYTEAIAINPQEFNWYNLRAEARMKIKNFYHAFFDYTRAMEIRKKSGVIFPLLKKRGIARLNIGDYTGAVSDFTGSISLNPNPDGESFYYRGLASYYLKELVETNDDMKSALALGIKAAAEYITDNV
jgi:tetratricopeptide (TPR) repeat protein